MPQAFLMSCLCLLLRLELFAFVLPARGVLALFPSGRVGFALLVFASVY